MKQYSIAKPNQYNKGTVYVQDGGTSHKIDYEILYDDFDEKHHQWLCERFKMNKLVNIQWGTINLEFYTNPEFKDTKIYSMQFDFVQNEKRYHLIESRFRSSYDKLEVFNYENGKFQGFNLFLVRLVEIFKEQLDYKNIDFENQLVRSNLISDKLVITQFAKLHPNSRSYKFDVSINVDNDKLTYNNVSVECDYGEPIEDLEWTGTYTFWEILNNIDLKIKEFARDKIKKYLEESKNRYCEDIYCCGNNPWEIYSVDDYDTSQIDDFSMKILRTYKVSNHLKTLGVGVTVESKFGKLKLVETERWDINIKNSIESKNFEEVLKDFDEKTKKSLKFYLWVKLESYIKKGNPKTLEELIQLDSK